MVQTLDEAVSARIHECTEAIAGEFRASVRPIYGSPNGLRPELIGSCLLLAVDGAKFVVTAAHVIDWTSSHALYVGGVVGTKPVQILGKIKSTPEPPGGRCQDRFDCAFWQVPSSAERALGAVEFVDQSRLSDNKVSPTGRVYMAMGYRLSRNKGKVDNVARTIKTVIWKYSANVAELPELALALGVSGNEHFFLKYDKYSFNSGGLRVSSVNPKGISGGALIDLGNFSSASAYDSRSRCVGMLCGMVIEKNKKHRALVGIKIEYIVNAIRRQRAL